MNKKFVNLLYYGLISISLIIFIKFALINFSNASSSQSLQGNLLIWYSPESNMEDVVNTSIDNFSKLNQQINILKESIPSNNNPSLFIEKARNGFGASALVVDAQEIQNLLAEKVIDTIDTQVINNSVYFPSVLNQVISEGEMYGIPLVSYTKVLCYNKAKLNTIEDSILSLPPTDLDGLIERAIKGYSVGLVSGFENTFWAIGAFGGKFVNELGEFQPNLTGWGKWMNWLKKASLQPNFILSSDRIFLHKAFAEGKLAYYTCESTEIPALSEKLQDNLRIALLPNGKEGNATPLVKTKVMVLNRSNSNTENDLALAFSKYITNPEQQLMGIIKTQSFIPVNRHLNLNLSLLPIESLLLKQAQLAVTIPLNKLDEMNYLFQKGEILYQEVFIGEISSLEGENKLMLLINNFQSK